MCQQFYVIRRMPAPGSAAEKAYHARLERKGKPIPGADAAKAKADAEAAEAAELAKQSGQRQQPASKKRKKSKAAGAKPAGQSRRQVGHPGHAEGVHDGRSRVCGRPEVGGRTARSRTDQRRPARRPATRPSPPRPDPPDRRRNHERQPHPGPRDDRTRAGGREPQDALEPTNAQVSEPSSADDGESSDDRRGHGRPCGAGHEQPAGQPRA